MTDPTKPDTFVKELRHLVEQQIMPGYEWYSTHTTWPRVAFRLAGVIVVIGSLLLPVITSAKDLPFRDGLLTTVSLAVAILSSLSTFYRWDSTWQTRTKTAKELQGLLAKWELALKLAETAQNPREAALSATQNYLTTPSAQSVQIPISFLQPLNRRRFQNQTEWVEWPVSRRVSFASFT